MSHEIPKQDIDAIALDGNVAYLYDHAAGTLRLVDEMGPAHSRFLSLFEFGRPLIQGEMDLCRGYPHSSPQETPRSHGEHGEEQLSWMITRYVGDTSSPWPQPTTNPNSSTSFSSPCPRASVVRNPGLEPCGCASCPHQPARVDVRSGVIVNLTTNGQGPPADESGGVLPERD